MRVYWTDRAKERLNDIEKYIAQDAPKVAHETIRRIINRSRQIGDLPHSGRQLQGYNNSNIREVLERPYRVIYQVRDDRIDVIAVMHYRQLLPHDIKKL